MKEADAIIYLIEMVDIFITNGRLLHHERILCLYSEYLQMSFKLNNYLLNNQTVLPVSYRYYLSIMAVSCYNCEYLLKIQEEQFILNGGDPCWLKKGLKAVDSKLIHIARLNELLAHKPWAIDAEEIKVRILLKFNFQFLLNTQKQNERWNTIEIIHAVLILSYYHGLCGIVFG